MITFKKMGAALAGTLLALTLALTGCQSTTVSDSGGNVEGQGGEGLTLTAGWAKATDNMTGVFGTLTNPLEEDVYLVAASSPLAGITEMHETAIIGGSTQMQEKPDGFLIPANGTYELEPGGDHIMLMQLERALLPGEELPLALEFSNGVTVNLIIDVRDFAGAIEEYAPGDHDDHANHSEHGEDHDSDPLE